MERQLVKQSMRFQLLDCRSGIKHAVFIQRDRGIKFIIRHRPHYYIIVMRHHPLAIAHNEIQPLDRCNVKVHRIISSAIQ